MNPWLGIGVILLGLLGLMVFCTFLEKKLSVGPELKRKTVHIGMGLLCTLFPFVFSEVWPVSVLAAVAIVSLLLIRKIPFLRRGLGSSLHDVERSSMGELFFPLAVLMVWFISLSEPLYYCLSILVLTLADGSAALIGTRYGQQYYSTREGYKTMEGSFFFFTVTFLCIHIPLLLLTDIGRAETLLLAVFIGIVVMVIEAVAWKGLDNLFIPLSVCLLLNVYSGYGVSQLLFRIIILISVISVFIVFRDRFKLDHASLLGAGVILFYTFIIGGWIWLLAPVTVLLNYLYLVEDSGSRQEKSHDIYGLLAVTAPAFFWLLLFYVYGGERFLFLYTISYMAALVCMYMAHWAFKYQNKSLNTISLWSSLVAWVMIFLPWYGFNHQGQSWKIVPAGLLIAFLSSQCFRFTQSKIRACPSTSERFTLQGLVAMGVSCFCVLVF